MNKIKLNLDDLKVQSFATTDGRAITALSCPPTGNSTSNDCPPEQYWTQYCGTSDTCDAYCNSGIGTGCSDTNLNCSADPNFYCYGTTPGLCGGSEIPTAIC
jgi:hypothetical protein